MAGCVYTRQPRVIYLKPGLKQPRGVMLHELGHVYDLTVLNNRTAAGSARSCAAARPAGGREAPLAEWFAEAYAWCARYTRIVSVSAYAIYAYDPTPAQHRDTCALIKTRRARPHAAAPPTAPPVVTGDPRLRPPPPRRRPSFPATRRVIPGPAPAENPSARVDPDADRDAAPAPRLAGDPDGDPDPDASRHADTDPDAGPTPTPTPTDPDGRRRADRARTRRPSPRRPRRPPPRRRRRRRPRTRRTRSRPRSRRPSRRRGRACTSATRTDSSRRVA